ncbi:hypothetical protein GCK72_013793 [Caenorhabditis remanei]|uniref:Glycosyltransferase family 92 protein n=1 Tax=Caenorhabditis remanei TaxID=31234 RepID=A0A6A5GPF3_CAERE|nr:hypothetical protein GCK72_013793 [Caenorhabditis remanei]KAF1757338.1 hypothetical protein GCK72_013793 [Caenorhabditis remanei]
MFSVEKQIRVSQEQSQNIKEYFESWDISEENAKTKKSEINLTEQVANASQESLNDPTRRLTRILPVSHVFIVSAYYYPTSKSLGENAIALNMMVDSKNFNLKNSTFNVLGLNETHREITVATSQIEGVPLCRYAPTMARTNTVSNLKRLGMESGGVKVEIPFKMARYTAPKPVIICISPQFVAEQWQLFVMQVHISNRFGGHLHIYLTSILESYFDLMREYERQEYITLDYWVRMKFKHSDTPYFEPNADAEWRNQAGAQTDCLLQYKEAAEYIAFFDMDDVLFLKDYSSYLEAFNAEWALQPNSSSIVYGRREHEFVKAETLSEFNFPDLLESLRSSDEMGTGKVVVRPDRYNSTWIHYSKNEDLTTRHFVGNVTMIHVQRPLQKNGDNEMTKLWRMDFNLTAETYNSEDIQAIENDIKRMKQLPNIIRIGSKLPREDYYLPIVFKCYYDIFYGPFNVEHTKRTQCPNAEMCEMPQREEYKCIHSDAEYYSGPRMEPFTFHFSTSPFWSKEIGCYQ